MHTSELRFGLQEHKYRRTSLPQRDRKHGHPRLLYRRQHKGCYGSYKTKMSKKEKVDMIEKLTNEMNLAAKNLDFERAMELRDIIFELESE